MAAAAQCEFAPAHNWLEIEAIRHVDRIAGAGARQIGVFDTAFNATLAPEAYVYPGPYEWLEHGVRRYGFHGISHQYAARRVAESLGSARRMVMCHLAAAVRWRPCAKESAWTPPWDSRPSTA